MLAYAKARGCSRIKLLAVFVAPLLLAPPVLAAGTGSGLGVKLAPGLRLVTTVTTRLSYTDNFYYQSDAGASKRDSFGLHFRPDLSFLGDAGRTQYWLKTGVDAASFSVRADQDDYIDRYVNGGLSYDLTSLHHFAIHAEHKKDHDPFGQDRTELGNASLPLRDIPLDKYTQNTGGALYQLGRPGGLLGLELAYDVVNTDYDTNRYLPGLPLGTRFLDYDLQTYRVTGLYHYSGKTSFLAEYLHTDVHIPHDFQGVPGREAKQDEYRIGAIWKATGQTSGDVRVGYLDRNYDDDARPDFKKVAWVAGVTWTPISRTQLRLETGRIPQETYYLGSGFIDNRFYRLKWTYDWTSRFQHTLSYSYSDSDFTDTTRRDKINSVQLTGDYVLSSYWKLQAGVRYTKRNVNILAHDYDRTYAYLGFKLER